MQSKRHIRLKLPMPAFVCLFLIINFYCLRFFIFLYLIKNSVEKKEGLTAVLVVAGTYSVCAVWLVDCFDLNEHSCPASLLFCTCRYFSYLGEDEYGVVYIHLATWMTVHIRVQLPFRRSAEVSVRLHHCRKLEENMKT